ncbi:hypothetical protein EVAR_70218_1 [Eumeta japonica]|uniref:Uncharacterized protein n=1 Tax=Eumeta variegata TaxID=151549 RepID=A0A4C1TAQ3_EUMVA|nr:hypothetical protein EVAR_70218_1 [Eumeta japonica]
MESSGPVKHTNAAEAFVQLKIQASDEAMKTMELVGQLPESIKTSGQKEQVRAEAAGSSRPKGGVSNPITGVQKPAKQTRQAAITPPKGSSTVTPFVAVGQSLSGTHNVDALSCTVVFLSVVQCSFSVVHGIQWSQKYTNAEAFAQLKIQASDEAMKTMELVGQLPESIKTSEFVKAMPDFDAELNADTKNYGIGFAITIAYTIGPESRSVKENSNDKV